MRDRLKDNQYFVEFLEEENARIEKFQEKLKNNEVAESRILPIKQKISSIKFGVWIARYSLGENIDILKNEYVQMLSEISRDYSAELYNDILWIVSIGILLDIEEDDFSLIAKLIEKSDWLYEYLLNYRNDNIGISDTVLFKKPYKFLYEIVNVKQNKIVALKEYLEKHWYKDNNDAGWYDSHKSKQNTYYGYWSFESGAIVKILGLDDTILKDVPYYPYDLVHYKDSK